MLAKNVVCKRGKKIVKKWNILIKSNFTLTSLCTIFLRRLYEDIHTVTPIPSNPEIFLQYIWGFVIISEQVKPELPES